MGIYCTCLYQRFQDGAYVTDWSVNGDDDYLFNGKSGVCGFFTGQVRVHWDDERPEAIWKPIVPPRGLPPDWNPEDVPEGELRPDESEWIFGVGWLTIDELMAFNYLERACQARREIYAELLGSPFFHRLRTLKDAGIDRIVFWFS